MSSSTSTWPFLMRSFTSTSTRLTVPESSLPMLTERVGCSVPLAEHVEREIALADGFGHIARRGAGLLPGLPVSQAGQQRDQDDGRDPERGPLPPGAGLVFVQQGLKVGGGRRRGRWGFEGRGCGHGQGFRNGCGFWSCRSVCRQRAAVSSARVQPPPSALYSRTWSALRLARVASRLSCVESRVRWVSSTARKSISPLA